MNETIPRLTFGERITIARRHAGYHTAAEFALAVGVSRATVSNWERDTTTPSAQIIVRIAAACRVPVPWLMEALTSGNTSEGDGVHAPTYHSRMNPRTHSGVFAYAA